MKKIILTAFAVLTLITGCNYDPNALMYGETRHIGIIEGCYVSKYNDVLVYELSFSETPVPEKEVGTTLRIYNMNTFNMHGEEPAVTVEGTCRLIDTLYADNYFLKDYFEK